MKNIPSNIKNLIAINIFFILISGGGVLGAMISIPLMLLINFITCIYGFVKDKGKLGIAALILFFIGPIIGFSICLSVY